MCNPGFCIRSLDERMRSVLALKAGIRVNPAETEWKQPLRHIAQFLLRNVG